ncbi:MAG TPA: ATP F0F1 synthase subunit B [Paracoccaceae bacterium]|nr:ATP F0F1 synthase subunit B [Paracoccaceae bacterium]
MTRILNLSIVLSALAAPAFAATGGLTLNNTNVVVSISFLLFIGVLLYFGVPKLLAGMLDKRAAEIKAELDEARSLREEAQTILATYERKQAEVKEQSEGIIAHAKKEAELASQAAQEELKLSIARRLKAADEQIASAEASAIREVRDRAVSIAIAAAAEVISGKMSADQAASLVEKSIDEVAKKLH